MFKLIAFDGFHLKQIHYDDFRFKIFYMFFYSAAYTYSIRAMLYINTRNVMLHSMYVY